MKTVELAVVPFKSVELPESLQAGIVKANVSFNWTEKMTRDDFLSPWSEYYVLVKGIEMLGYVGLHHVLDEASVNTVYIHSSLRKQGLGSYLMIFVLEQLGYRGVKHVFLEVREQNQAAIGLYRKVGFDQLLVRHNYYQNPTDNAVIMQYLMKNREVEAK